MLIFQGIARQIIGPAQWPLAALVLFVVIRPLSTSLTLLPTRLTRTQRLFIAWFVESARARSYQSATPQRSWADEHPVKFGALVGAGVGAVIGIIAFKTADCPTGQVCSTRAVALTFYPTVGAGLGALFGLVRK